MVRPGIAWRSVAAAASFPLVIALGAAVRAWHVRGATFPLNDGGLFYAMIRDIQAANFALPQHTSYNGGDIPFAYPPGALYLAAGLDALLPIELATLLVLLPLIGAIATLPAFAAVARAILPSRRDAVLATAAFALVPVAFTWLLPGGGLPRGIGLALALLAVREAYFLVSDGQFSRHRALAAGLLAAATTLVHLETAAFLGVTFAVLAAVHPRTGVARLAPVALLAGVASAPWWGLVVARHGFEPFVASTDQGGALLDDGRLSWPTLRYALEHPLPTAEPGLALIAALAVVGSLLAISRGRLLLPLWCVALAVVAMRASPTFASVPIALLAGSALGDILDLAPRGSGAPPLGRALPGHVLALAICGLIAVPGAFSRGGAAGEAFTPLPEADRAAMRWAAEHTPPDARFAVVPATGWWVDSPSEWFPELALRESIATPQGREWLGGAFAAALTLHDALARCRDASTDCLNDVAASEPFTHVYLPSACCDALARSLRSSPDYLVAYDRGGVLIAAKR